MQKTPLQDSQLNERYTGMISCILAGESYHKPPENKSIFGTEQDKMNGKYIKSENIH
jgi:hypothetical protein